MAAPRNDLEPDLEHDPHAWRDDIVYGMRFHTPDLIEPNRASDDWGRALILDIDHIVDRTIPNDQVRRCVVPADLVFFDVHDTEMSIGRENPRFSAGACEPTIDQIIRQPAACRKLYRWRIVLNPPTGGEIVFQARGFELVPRRRVRNSGP